MIATLLGIVVGAAIPLLTCMWWDIRQTRSVRVHEFSHQRDTYFRALHHANTGAALVSWRGQPHPVEFERILLSDLWSPYAWRAHEHERFYEVPEYVRRCLEKRWHAANAADKERDRLAYDAQLRDLDRERHC